MNTAGTTREESMTMSAIQEIARNQIELRDYLAGQALAGLACKAGESMSAMDVAVVCYQVADAMLKVRNTTTE